MNIESYIIIFIKKEKYLNLPGIGNFKLVKKDGEEEVEFSTVSIIDDRFASFIGVNENVSANNAANAISKYSKELKQNLKDGKTVNLPGLGKLKMENGQIEFEKEQGDTFLKPTENRNFRELKFGSGSLNNSVSNDDDSGFHVGVYEMDNQNPTPDPVSFETETYNPAYDVDTILEETQRKERQKRFTRNLLSIILLLAIVGILIWAFYNFLYRQDSNDGATSATEVVEQPNDAETNETPNNSDANASANSGNSLKIVTKTYDSEISADKRVKQLESYGWKVEKVTDSAKNSYSVAVVLPNDGRTEEAVTDSVKALLNPGGEVYILK